MRKGLMVVVAMIVAVVLVPDVAGAAGGNGQQVGENLGNLLGDWAKSLFVGIAGLVSLMFLLNRRFADLAIFMVAALLVGGFVMAPNDIASTVKDIWHTVTG